jgi:chemotaxis protein CheZ
MARQLHDSLRELGYDKIIENSARQIPDARQRLTYIAQMTEQAASRVLNATDIAKPLQDDLLARSEALAARWQRMFTNQLSVDEFKSLAADSHAFFGDAPGKIKATNEQLMEIMMAQDFQDLTGQVIRKVVDLVQGLESQLLQVLIEAMPPASRNEANSGLLNGPVIDAAGRNDVVASQSQVDELLESLGF